MMYDDGYSVIEKNVNMKQKIGKYEGAKVKKYYDVVRGDVNDEYGIDANVFEYLKKILPRDLRDKTVLDLGCGDGRWSEYLSMLGAKKVLGVDISQDMVDLALQRVTKKSLENVEIVRADIQNLLIEDSLFDIAFSTFSLMYFTNLEEVVCKISKILKNGGRLYISTNIIHISDHNLREKLKGSAVPVVLGGGNQKIVVENLVQSAEQYHSAFASAGLIIEIEKYFEPEGVYVDNDFEYKTEIILKKAVFQLLKMTPHQ